MTAPSSPVASHERQRAQVERVLSMPRGHRREHRLAACARTDDLRGDDRHHQTGEGIAAEGPFPSDTVFVRARSGAFDAVVTMYHDQGQIAMKLMGFDRGVTLLGGFKFPICTPAHGTAYDIAGQGVASVGATRAALLLAAEMAARR